MGGWDRTPPRTLRRVGPSPRVRFEELDGDALVLFTATGGAGGDTPEQGECQPAARHSAE